MGLKGRSEAAARLGVRCDYFRFGSLSLLGGGGGWLGAGAGQSAQTGDRGGSRGSRRLRASRRGRRDARLLCSSDAAVLQSSKRVAGDYSCRRRTLRCSSSGGIGRGGGMRLARQRRASRRRRSPRVRCCGSCGCTVGIRHLHSSCAIRWDGHCRLHGGRRGRSRRRLLELLRRDVREATAVATRARARIFEREAVRLHVIGRVRMAAPLAFLHARAHLGSLPTAAHGRLDGGSGSCRRGSSRSQDARPGQRASHCCSGCSCTRG